MVVLERRAIVGRGAESARLRDLWAAVGEGHERTVIVGGEAGIGKSRLVDTFAREVRAAGATVLEGACLRASGSELPYAPFVEVLRTLVRETPESQRPALLGPGRAELSRLLPELAIRAADIRPASELDRTSQARLFELMLGVIERLAHAGPVLLVIEDLQWADRSTRDLARFLVHALRDAPVLIVMTFRSDSGHDGAEESAFLAELEHEDHVERIELGPLSRDEVEAQLRGLLGVAPDPSDVDALVERTDGNPFFIEELVSAGPLAEVVSASGGILPPVLRDVLGARIRSLSEPGRDVLRAAAVAGRRLDDELLAAALGTSSREIGAALREALDSGILARVEIPRRADGTKARGPASAFRHELLREAVDAEVFPAERAALHSAFAEALEERLRAGRPVPAARIAHHWDEAGRPDRAFEPMVDAARAAEAVYAYADALRLWESAIRLARTETARGTTGLEPAPRGDVTGLLERAAECAVLAGEYARGVELGRAAVASVDASHDPVRAGHLHERLRWYLWEAGDRAAAVAAVEEALRLIPTDPPSQELGRALGQRAGIALLRRRYADAKRDAERAVSISAAVGATADEAFALAIVGWCEAVLGDVDAGVARFRRAAVMAEGLGSVEGMALAASNLVSLLDRVGRPVEALATAREAYELTERYGVARTYGALLLGFAAKAQYALGMWDDADASTSAGLRLRPTGRAEEWLLVNRGRLLAARGRFVEAEGLLRRARTIEDRIGGTEFRTPLLAAAAELAVWARRPEDARRSVEEGSALADDEILPDPGLSWLAALGLRALADEAELVRARGDDASVASVGAAATAVTDVVARSAASMAAAIAREGGRGTALAGLIAAEAARAHGEDRADRWAQLAADWTALGRPFNAAYARLREGSALLRARGSREAAASALREAGAIARRLGADPLRIEVETLARHARIDLGARTEERPAGRTDGAAAPRETHGFTGREMEVLRLVAGGWTNQQIADVLYITRKTASVHVSNIMAKLGVDSRVEAAAIAHRIGIGADAPLPPDRRPDEGA